MRHAVECPRLHDVPFEHLAADKQSIHKGGGLERLRRAIVLGRIGAVAMLGRVGLLAHNGLDIHMFMFSKC
jgi:hypothetical protein